MNNYEWETWNRKMRDLLVRTQVRDGTCANGSWDPANDAWGKSGGRVMQTALSTLTWKSTIVICRSSRTNTAPRRKMQRRGDARRYDQNVVWISESV